MTNTTEFRIALIRAKKTMEELANEIGISPASLSYKVNNRREFTSKEIKAISEVLGLPLEDKEKIFFANEVDY